MPKYLIHGIVKIDVQTEIEADNKAQAMWIASKMSGSEFDEEGLTDGEEIFISTAQLVDENGEIVYSNEDDI
jgi:frataxin-like iron-binding protein CyaY